MAKIKLIVMIACLLLTVNVYADQTKDADTGADVQQKAPNPSPGWAGANSEPPFNDDESLEPSYSDVDEPSFGDDKQL